MVRGFGNREPNADFLVSGSVIPKSLRDPDVLELAANLSQNLRVCSWSHDYATMPGHFCQFIRDRQSSGLILIRQLLPVGHAIEELQIVWLCREAAEFRNRIVYLPL
jgi:hypothetical protein